MCKHIARHGKQSYPSIIATPQLGSFSFIQGDYDALVPFLMNHFLFLDLSRTDEDKRVWVEKLKAMRLLYEEKNNNYWRSEIEIAASKGDTRRLWRTFQSEVK